MSFSLLITALHHCTAPLFLSPVHVCTPICHRTGAWSAQSDPFQEGQRANDKGYLHYIPFGSIMLLGCGLFL